MSHLKRPSFLVWLALPISFFVGIISLEILWTTNTLNYFYDESGPAELIQFVMLLICLCILIRILTYRLKHNYNWLKYFLGFCFVCCFYIAAEEISWGQSFLEWKTNDWWRNINNQEETNLHNTSRWLNQIPRYGLMAAIAIGGLVLPFLHLLGKNISPQKYDIIRPPNVLSVTAVMLLVLALGNKISKVIIDEKLFIRSSEIEELFIYLFIMIYLILLKHSMQNIRQFKKA